MVAPAQLLHNWHEQRPSNQGGLDSSVTRDTGIVCYMGGPAHYFHFCTVVHDCCWVAF
jgi:hypothetical protein